MSWFEAIMCSRDLADYNTAPEEGTEQLKKRLIEYKTAITILESKIQQQDKEIKCLENKNTLLQSMLANCRMRNS